MQTTYTRNNGTEMTIRKDGAWIYDEKDNRESLIWSEDRCIERLKTLSGCSRCSGCSGCSRCSGCSDCSRCSDCSGCSDCSDCSDCSRCSRCSDCSDCSRCSRCSRCSGKVNQKGGSDLPEIPAIPDIHRAIYEAVSRPGALNMSIWHTCDTTHCRAGWAVTLAGEKGQALEAATSTAFAAQQIYKASGAPISPVRFYETDAVAMADMKRLSEAESAVDLRANAEVDKLSGNRPRQTTLS